MTSTNLLPYKPEGIPASLQKHPHWLVCDSKGKPVQRIGVGNSKSNPKDWVDFETASHLAEQEPGLWPYLVLNEETEFTIFDVDFKPKRQGETDLEHAARLQRAQTALDRLREWLPQRYEERSKSGNGYHLIVRGKFNGTGNRGKGDWADVEIYTRGHGVALTGHIEDGHDNPALYPDEQLQSIRDMMKGSAPAPVTPQASSLRESPVKPDWARQVLEEIEQKHGRPGYHDWINLSSATFNGVGVDLGIELLSEIWPEEKAGEYRRLAASLGTFIPWQTLCSFGVSPDDPSEALDSLPDLETEEDVRPKANRKKLTDFLVNHADTIGLSWQEIDALRPPFVIDGFLRQGEVLLLGAESKSRKSWLAQDAAIAVAGGIPWLADEAGENGFSTAQARVHVIDLELNPSEMRFRFAKARGNRFHDCPENAAAITARISAYSFDGMNVADIMPLLEELRLTVQPGDLVIVDCLYRLVPDGNETKDVAAILETVKRLAAETMAGVIVVDHFRKAGDDKARNRFAGSFVKQASASTLVAVEVTADDVLVLNIDARTFHGCKRVHARFNPETYAFNRLPEAEVTKAKEEKTRAETEGWLLALWRGRQPDSAITAADGMERWKVSRQAAVTRLGRLVSLKWLAETKNGTGKASTWSLLPGGVGVPNPDSDGL